MEVSDEITVAVEELCGHAPTAGTDHLVRCLAPARVHLRVAVGPEPVFGTLHRFPESLRALIGEVEARAQRDRLEAAFYSFYFSGCRLAPSGRRQKDRRCRYQLSGYNPVPRKKSRDPSTGVHLQINVCLYATRAVSRAVRKQSFPVGIDQGNAVAALSTGV